MPQPQASPQGFREVRRLVEVDSTNRYLLDEAERGVAAGLVVVADHQSAGRGRLGRAWEAPPGASLLVSVLLRPGLAPTDRQVVVMAAAVAMAEAVEATTGVHPELKWPNDLLAGGRKLGGILAEASGDAVVVGIGVNLDWPGVPPGLEGIATACNLEGGRPATRDDVLDAFLRRYSVRLDDLDTTRRDYRARLGTLGRRVRVERADGTVVGTAQDVDGAGHLIVDVDGTGRVVVSAGDVVHLRPAEGDRL